MRRPPQIGTEVDGKYRLIRHVDSGGMGDIFEAEDLNLGRRVALKVLSPIGQGGRGARTRLMREARAAAAVRHPAIVQVYDVGSDGETDYVAMELLEGEDLHARIRRTGPMPVELVTQLALDLTEALVAMHEAGIVHRDLKPRNLFLARVGRQSDVLKVLDFGIAKAEPSADDTITATGDILGTPAYMAPERLRNAKLADPRSDIWSVGVTLYEALTGAPPFVASSPAELILKISLDDPAPILERRPETPAQLARVVDRAILRDPEARFQSARELHAALLGPYVEDRTAATKPERAAWSESDGSASKTGPAESHGPRANPGWKRRSLLLVSALSLLGLMTLWLRSASEPAPSASSHPSPRAGGTNADASLIESTPISVDRPIAASPRDSGINEVDAARSQHVDSAQARHKHRLTRETPMPSVERIQAKRAHADAGTPETVAPPDKSAILPDKAFSPAGTMERTEF